MEFKIYYPTENKEKSRWSKEFGLNAIYAGKHWAKRREDAQYWHIIVNAALRKQEVPKAIYKRRVRITMLWNDRLDIDNHAYMGKMIVDSLKGYLIKDDTRRYLKSIKHDFHDKDYILVRIEEE